MIEGWKINSDWEDANKMAIEHIFKMDAEPVFSEIGEKVITLAEELHEKILTQELQWSLMLTSLEMVERMKDMCDAEVDRRKKEMETLSAKEGKTNIS